MVRRHYLVRTPVRHEHRTECQRRLLNPSQEATCTCDHCALYPIGVGQKCTCKHPEHKIPNIENRSGSRHAIPREKETTASPLPIETGTSSRLPSRPLHACISGGGYSASCFLTVFSPSYLHASPTYVALCTFAGRMRYAVDSAIWDREVRVECSDASANAVVTDSGKPAERRGGPLCVTCIFVNMVDATR